MNLKVIEGGLRLKSRKPPRIITNALLQDNVMGITKWHSDRILENPDRPKIVTHLTIRQAGFDMPRKIWMILNRQRTGHGRWNYLMYNTQSAHSKTLQSIFTQLIRMQLNGYKIWTLIYRYFSQGHKKWSMPVKRQVAVFW